MTKSLLKNTLREIKMTKARFISIVLIIALGVGFFVGVKCTNPSMVDMAERYYKDTNLMDFRLVSTVGFDKEDVEAVKNTEGVESVMPSYFSDVILDSDGKANVIRLMAAPYSYEGQKIINQVMVKSGRLPEKRGEIAVENGPFMKLKLGDKINISDKIDNENTKDTIKDLEYEIVGIVQSSQYISFERGNTTVGTGKISAFAYIPKDDFKSERYTELYVNIKGSKDISPFSDEYKELINKYEKKFESLSDERLKIFKRDNIDDAQKELDDGKKEYKEKSKETYEKLADGQRELDNAQLTYDNGIKEGQEKLDSAKKEIKKGEKQLASSKKEYEKGKKEFTAKFAKARKELDANWDKYDSAYKSFCDNEKKELETNISAIEEGMTTTASTVISTVISELPEGTAEIKKSLEKILDKVTYSNAVESLEKTKEILNKAGIKDFDLTIDENIESIKGMSDTRDELKNTLDAAMNEFKSQKEQLENAEIKYSTEKATYKAKLDYAAKEIAAGSKKISDSKIELKAGEEELETSKSEGLIQLQDARNEYAKGKEKAHRELNKAKKKLDDAQEKLDKFKDPKWYYFNRDDNPGYATFIDNCDRVDNVATVFPLFFLLVAMLVCLTTMTRLVEEKRTEEGTLKALGYSNAKIVLKFLIYSSLAAVLGCVIGCSIGIPVFPRVIYGCYKIMYNMIDINIVLSTSSLIIGLVAAILCSVVVSLIVCYKALKGRPAALMRPKAPKNGKRIVLERITFLWKRLSFTSKVTQRNLFRYKSRLFMTAIGIAGCTALIIAGFGLYDSISDIANKQFGEIIKYDASIISDGEYGDFGPLMTAIEKDKRIDKHMMFFQESVSVSSDKEKVDDDLYLCIPRDFTMMPDYIELRNRVTKEHYEPSLGEAVITEKIAKILGVDVGDKVYLDKDKNKAVTISGICENYIYGYLYMNSGTYEKIYDKPVKFNMVLAKVPNMDSKLENQIGNEYLKRDDVTAISFISAGIKDFQDMIQAMKLVTVVLVVCAGALAIVVLYNLTNINLSERRREIATIKVLGFKNSETAAFVYRENIFLTLLGIIVGLVLGTLLTYFIVTTVEIDKIMFGRDIYFTTYLIGILGTAFFSAVVNFIMYFKIKKIDMVESLKSIE